MTDEVAQLIEVHKEGEEFSESNGVEIQDPKNGQAEKIIVEENAISSDLQSPFNNCTGKGEGEEEEDSVRETIEEFPQETDELKGPGFWWNKNMFTRLEIRGNLQLWRWGTGFVMCILW